MDRSVIPAPTHQAGEKLHGFVIDNVTEVDDIKALVYELRHEKTGAEVVHVHCNDEENLFSVGFRTPPPDSTGVAHILEHSVLAGSEQFPVNDAFNELRKRTLNTFLNAMTWPDRTVYPAASAVKADYWNLARVYADLVFHPRLKEQTFKQEGHHLEPQEFNDPESGLKVSGVVYNEMKGANSSPERIAFRTLMETLLPDTPYANDSGGDPEAIPELTYDDFVGFHRRYYSATNARFFLYGDVSLAENLAFLEEVLAPFDKVDVDSDIPLQEFWEEPQSVSLQYAIGSEDSTDEKTFVMLGWLANETTDVEESVLLDVALGALTGSAAAPVRKALIDSGLGQDVFPSGSYWGGSRQSQVVIGLRGTEAEHADEIETLIRNTIHKVIEEGLDEELIEANFHQIEFSGREISPPFPIMLLTRANPLWYFGGDPKDGLRFGTLLEKARRTWKEDPEVFQKLLKKWLVDNPHRARVVLTPSTTLNKEREEAFERRMKELESSLSSDELQQIAREAVELKKAQEAPEDPEDLAKLPRLTLDEIPREVRTFETRERTHKQVTVLEHPDFSNGVGYVGLFFDTRDISHELSIALPFMGRATRGLGAGGLTYDQMSTRIARHSGGIGVGPMVGRHLSNGDLFEGISVSGSALERNGSALFDILGELLLESDTSDHKRIRDLLKEGVSRKLSSVVPSGHAYARSRAAAALDLVHWRNEQWGGTAQLRYLNQLKNEDSLDRLAAQIAELQKRVFTRNRVMLSLAGDPQILETLRPLAESFLAALPEGAPMGPPVDDTVPGEVQDIAVSIPAPVNYCATVFEVPNMLDERAPAFELLSKVLRAEYLYQKVRVQGGAYGGMSSYGKGSGLFSLLSYRDPRLVETFDVYEHVIDFIKSDAFNDEAVDASRIGAIGAYDNILTPSQQLSVGRRRRLIGLDDGQRRQFRDGLFDLTADQIREQTLPVLEAAMSKAPRAVFGSAEAIAAANTVLTERPFHIEALEE